MKVVVIGGGAVGSSVAYHLALRGGFEVTVLERDPSYARASSALSASSIREQFSTPINIAMSQFGLEFLQRPEALAVDGDVPALALHRRGYLFLATPAGLPVLRANHAIQRCAGAEVALLSPAELTARFPYVSTNGIAAGSLGAREGWFDGPALLAALRRKARALGVTYLAACADGFATAGGRVTAVRAGEHALPCDVAVNAAGAWAGQVAGWLGQFLPIRPRRRQVTVFACPEALPDFPLLIDPGGSWVRPDGPVFLAGRSPGPGEPDPDEPPLEVIESEFTDGVWPALAARVAAFERLRVRGGWAGYYEMHDFDHNGVVGPVAGAANLVHAAGFSGHGMQHAPAAGRGVAEWIATGRFATLDLSPLSPDRIAAGRPLVERNVV